MAFILERVAMMLDCFPERADAPAALGQASALASVLADYPDEIIHKLTDPARGMPVRQKWRPLPYELKQACEEEMAPIRRQWERDRIAEHSNRLLAAPEAPSLEQRRALVEKIKAQHGPAYGIAHTRVSKKPLRPMTEEELLARCDTVKIEVSDELRSIIANSPERKIA